MKVRDLMTGDVVTVERNDQLILAEEVMKTRNIRHLPVVEEGRLVGILTQRDLYQASMSNAMGFGEKARKEFLKTVVVKEAMTEPVETIEPDADIKEAARKLLDRRVGCLPVVEKGKLVGILSESDLLRFLAG